MEVVNNGLVMLLSCFAVRMVLETCRLLMRK